MKANVIGASAILIVIGLILIAIPIASAQVTNTTVITTQGTTFTVTWKGSTTFQTTLTSTITTNSQTYTTTITTATQKGCIPSVIHQCIVPQSTVSTIEYSGPESLAGITFVLIGIMVLAFRKKIQI